MQLNINTTYPRVEIEQHWPRLEIEQELPQIRLTTTGPRLEIDQRQPFNEIGMGDYTFLNQQIKQKSYSEVLTGIQRMAQEGNRIIDEAGLPGAQHSIPRIVKEQIAQEVPEVNVQVAPRTRPTILFHYDMNIDWKQGGVAIEQFLRPPVSTWRMGEVSIEVEKGAHFDYRG